MLLLTFDIEDYTENFYSKESRIWKRELSIVVATTEYILKVLRINNVKSIFYIVGTVAERFPELIRSIHADGHLIGSHSYAHELVYHQSTLEFELDLKKSLEILERITGTKIEHYRAPSFSLDKGMVSHIEILKKNGIKYNSSEFKGFRLNAPQKSSHDCNVELLDIPIEWYNIFGIGVPLGGGYFRLLPKMLLKLMLKNRSSAVTYFHPADFVSNKNDKASLNLVNRIRKNIGKKNAQNKFEWLVSNAPIINPVDYLMEIEKK